MKSQTRARRPAQLKTSPPETTTLARGADVGLYACTGMESTADEFWRNAGARDELAKQARDDRD
jgi:hypothetical protein